MNADFHVEGEIIKLDEEEHLAFGWFYQPDLEKRDHSGEYASIEELEKAAYPYVRENRVGGDMHVKRDTGELVESMVFTPEKLEKMGFEEDLSKPGFYKGSIKPGWWGGFLVKDDAQWSGVKSGERPMFSIAGAGKRKMASDTLAKAEEELDAAQSWSGLPDIGKAYLDLLAGEVASEISKPYPKGSASADHEPSIKCNNIYEALRRKGYPKAKAARISNECSNDPSCRCH